MIAARAGKERDGTVGLHQFGRAAEFTHHHDQRFVKQTAGLHVVDQIRHPAIEIRQEIAQGDEVVVVRVPQSVITDVGLYDRYAGLDQPPRHEHRLAKNVPAVAIAHRLRLVFNGQRPRQPAAGQNAECFTAAILVGTGLQRRRQG